MRQCNRHDSGFLLALFNVNHCCIGSSFAMDDSGTVTVPKHSNNFVKKLKMGKKNN